MSPASCSPFREWYDRAKAAAEERQREMNAKDYINEKYGSLRRGGNNPYGYGDYGIWQFNAPIRNDFELEVDDLFQEAQDILLRKHRDYGPSNIADAPGGAMNGLLVRMHDKIARLKNLYDNGQEPNYEAARDTLLDLANYALIGVLVEDGAWPA